MQRSGASPARTRLAMVMLHGRCDSAAGILRLAEQLALPDIAALAPQAAGGSWWPQSFLAVLAENEPWLSSALSSNAPSSRSKPRGSARNARC